MPSEIADACLWGTVLDASGTLLAVFVVDTNETELTIPFGN